MSFRHLISRILGGRLGSAIGLQENKKGFAMFFSADVLQYLITFLLLPVFTRLMSQDQLGRFSLFRTLVAFAIPIVSWGGAQVVARETSVSEDGRAPFATALRINVLMTVPLAFILGALVNVPVIDAWLSTNLFRGAVWLLVPVAFCEAGILVWSANQSTLKRFRQVSLARLIKAVLASAFSLLAITLFVPLAVNRSWAYLASSFAVLGFIWVQFWIAARKTGAIRRPAGTLRRHLSFGAPLAGNLLLASAHNMADRLLVTSMLAPAELAVYGVGYTAGSVVMMIGRAYHSTWQPGFFTSRERGSNPGNSGGFKFFVIAFLILTAVYALSSTPIVRLLLPASYAESAAIMAITAMSYTVHFCSLFAVSTLVWEKRPSLLVISQGVAVAANIGLNVLFIPVFGIVGAALATLVSKALDFAVKLISARRWDQDPDRAAYRRVAVCAAAAVIVGASFSVRTLAG